MVYKGIYCCPNCGSRSIEPLQLVSGPIATVDDWDGSYRCLECGKAAVPIFFQRAEDWVLFRQDMKGNVPQPEEAAFVHIPIVPVDTRSLLSQTGFDLPIFKVAEVVTVEWDGRTFQRTDYAAPFERYWLAISGTRYNCKQIMLMDLAGINAGRPNFKAMRDLVRKKYEVWLDVGISSEQDLFDAFSLEARKALADTSTVSSMDLFEELYQLSDQCVPCIQVFGDVVWGAKQPHYRTMEATVRALTGIGFKEIAVMDLSQLGKRKGFSSTLLERLEGLDAQMIVGGGVLESDLDRLREAGLAGAFIEPFTPIISDLISDEGEKVPADAPDAAPLARKRPRYLATD
jgi:uncharacterized protein related to proFAR isomerase